VMEIPEVIFEDDEPVIVFWDSIPFYKLHDHDFECDKCGLPKGNLLEVPFLYLDCNDKVHPDAKPPLKYRQYKVCRGCWRRGV
jgi:hypothetical protein